MRHPTVDQQAAAFLALEGLGTRCGRHIAACFHNLMAELQPLVDGGVDISDHVAVLVAQLRETADAWERETRRP